MILCQEKVQWNRDEAPLIQEAGEIISADDDSIRVLRVSRHDSGPDLTEVNKTQ